MSKTVDVKFKIINPDYSPFYATEEAAGFDLFANENLIIPPHSTRIVKTGLFVELPIGYEMQVRPRSGKSAKTSLRIANSPGTIDSDYRGEIGIICDNIGDDELVVVRGERIAQGVLAEVPKANFIHVYTLNKTDRDEKGFGSSGG